MAEGEASVSAGCRWSGPLFGGGSRAVCAFAEAWAPRMGGWPVFSCVGVRVCGCVRARVLGRPERVSRWVGGAHMCA